MTGLKDGDTYDIKFNSLLSQIIFPGPKYIIDNNGDIIDYYSDVINRFENQTISMKFRGLSRVDGKPMFEINILSISRDRILKDLLDK